MKATFNFIPVGDYNTYSKFSEEIEYNKDWEIERKLETILRNLYVPEELEHFEIDDSNLFDSRAERCYIITFDACHGDYAWGHTWKVFKA